MSLNTCFRDEIIERMRADEARRAGLAVTTSMTPTGARCRSGRPSTGTRSGPPVRPVTVTIDGRRAGPRRAADPGRAGPRHLHPAVLLARAHEAGRACAACAWSRSKACAGFQPACTTPVADGMVVHTQSDAVKTDPGRRARVPAHQPPARLPGVRPRRRVPAAGPDPRVRARASRASSRRSATSRSRSRSQRPGAARPGALHPVRALHPLRRRDRGRPAHRLRRARRPHARSQLRRRAVRLVLLGQHRADLPGRRAHRAPVPVPGPALGPRDGRDVVRRRARCSAAGALAVVVEPARAPARRRLRAGQPRLALRQGPLRPRVGALRRPAASSRMVRRATASCVEVSWPDALDAAAAADPRHARHRTAPSAIAVLGGARGTNEDAYLWARLAKGVIGTDHVDAQLGDGLPADVVLGMPRATIADLDRATAIVLLAPDLKEELPVLYLRVRRAAVELGVPLVDLAAARPRPDPVRHRDAPPSAGRSRRGGERRRRRARWPPGRTRSARRSSRPPPGATAPSSWCSGEPPSPSSPTRSSHARRRRFAGVPDVRFLSALRRGNVHGALDLGLTPGFLPGRVTLDAGRDWFTKLGCRARRPTGSTRPGILAAPRPTGKIARAHPGALRPARRLPRRHARPRARSSGRAPSSRSAAFLTPDVARAPTSCLPPTLWGEKTRQRSPTSRVGCSASAARSPPDGAAMDDWRIAAELATRLGHRLRPRDGRRGHRRDRPGRARVRRRRRRPAPPGPRRRGAARSPSTATSSCCGRAACRSADDGSDRRGSRSTPVARGGRRGRRHDRTPPRPRPTPSAPRRRRRCPLHRWDGTAPAPSVTPRDAYALRLVAGRHAVRRRTRSSPRRPVTRRARAPSRPLRAQPARPRPPRRRGGDQVRVTTDARLASTPGPARRGRPRPASRGSTSPPTGRARPSSSTLTSPSPSCGWRRSR